MSDAVEKCRASMARHGKSFALASKLLPRACRDDAAVVYAWCRRADDAIDLTSGREQRDALHALRAELSALYEGDPLEDEVPRQFREVVMRRKVPRTYPEELLAGMQMDALDHHYRTVDDLMLYAYRVASTVGLMMCHVMGVADPRALRHAAHLGMAMQLTNVCRDVAEDWGRGRLYLPEEVLGRHGAPGLSASLGGELPAQGVRACRGALTELLSLADRYYASGDRGLDYLSPRCALSVDIARRVYSSIGCVIAESAHDVTAPRAVVSPGRKLWHCAGALGAALRRSFRPRSRPLDECSSSLHYGPELLTP